MKKKIILIFIILFICTIAFSQENNKGLHDFLTRNIGNQVSINIIYADTIIVGKLLNVYEDGIIIETKFNKIFVTIHSIVYAKIKMEQTSD